MFRALIDRLQSWTCVHDFVASASPVGVIDLRVPSSVPFQIYYPAAGGGGGTPASWFRDSLADTMLGHLYVALPSLRRFHRVVAFILSIIAFVLPPSYYRVPCLSRGAPPDALRRRPLIVFSHGLTGTSEEHAVMFVHLVQQGYIVAALTHCDGSSSSAALPTGERMFYRHPNYKAYNVEFRPEQVRRREEELYAMKTFVLESDAMPHALRQMIDPTQIFAMGFSYGAATAALSVARHGCEYKGVVLLDGWFSIDLAPFIKGGPQFKFPAEAHAREAGLSPVPSCFIGSEQFDRIGHLAGATKDLCRKSDPSDCHVLPQSKHQNFVDLGFWVPARPLRMLGVIGACDYHKTLAEILKLQSTFLRKHTV